MAGGSNRAPPLVGARRRRGLILIVALSLAQAAATGVAAFATRRLFSALHEGAEPAIADFALLVGAGVAIGGARVVLRMVGERLGQSYARDVREALFRHAARMSSQDVRMRRTGYMSLRFVGDLAAFKTWVARGLPNLIAGAVILPATVAVLYMLHPYFGLAAALSLPPALGVLLLLSGPLAARYAALRKARARLAAEMAERMPLAPELDRMGRRGAELRLIRDRSARLTALALRRTATAEGARAIADILLGCLAALIIAVGFAAPAPASAVAAALAATGILAATFRDLAGVAAARAGFIAAREKLEAALDRPVRKRRPVGDKALPDGPLSLSLPMAAGRRIEVAAGDMRNLEADPGVDWSRAFGWLAGREDAPEGVRIAGLRPRDLSADTLRGRVALIDRDPLFLAGSLRRALTLGLARRPSDDLILAAASDWGLSALVERLGGLDGAVAEGGRNLSERERILCALVRSRLSRPGLWLIDGVGSILGADQFDKLRRNVCGAAATVVTVNCSCGPLPDGPTA